MKKYIYFASYALSDIGRTGYGNAEFAFTKKITSFKDLDETTKFIKEKNNGTDYFKVVILNFILLRTEKSEVQNEK